LRSQSIDDVVEPQLEQAKETLARRRRDPGGLAEEIAELPLAQPVEALGLLLLAEQEGVPGQAWTVAAVLAGG